MRGKARNCFHSTGQKKGTILNSLKQVINVYKGKGNVVKELEFTEWNKPVHMILADNEARVLKEEIKNCRTRVNITANKEHVPEVEWQISVIKERARVIVQTLPYENIPMKMGLGLIQYVVYWLNNKPKAGQDYSLRRTNTWLQEHVLYPIWSKCTGPIRLRCDKYHEIQNHGRN